ncbi:gnat family acetyltransferase [Diplodia corticola]|uniref:Gnat family acetyltransferase n=1 Tax=Diplodia corticola TaxID=236234 RepID=A0A1J9R4Z7_9PEZI|nr:gnat family acetyltransferase [Diplodia corticola]OJD35306.1 gnat family acetyltransferase [Diplodia corticola]
MPLEIRPVSPADADAMVSITNAALGSSGLIRLKHASPPHPAYRRHHKAGVLKALAKPTARVLKVVDTDTDDDEIIAIGHWEIYDNGRPDEEIAELEKPFEPLEEERERFGVVQRDFFEYLFRVRREVGKMPHYYLSLLVTHPDHYRRGAGSMIVRWGTERADRDGLVCILEASEAGRPLYKRHGFVERVVTTFDLTKYGGTGTDENTTMIRQAVEG